MEEKICQSCSMPLTKDEDFGTMRGGGKSDEYCVHCLKDGEFTQDITLEQAIAQCVQYADMAGVTKEEALAYAKQVFPTLKRWNKQ
ncbi:MAG: zinc ribbon domain-containing protein [Oscillospiraceae bacterium]|nr:zinc ribbon domain-containing protein [Oscillospiraceae bacterium]